MSISCSNKLGPRKLRPKIGIPKMPPNPIVPRVIPVRVIPVSPIRVGIVTTVPLVKIMMGTSVLVLLLALAALLVLVAVELEFTFTVMSGTVEFATTVVVAEAVGNCRPRRVPRAKNKGRRERKMGVKSTFIIILPY